MIQLVPLGPQSLLYLRLWGHQCWHQRPWALGFVIYGRPFGVLSAGYGWLLLWCLDFAKGWFLSFLWMKGFLSVAPSEIHF